jgi:lactoylglutathione lyase
MMCVVARPSHSDLFGMTLVDTVRGPSKTLYYLATPPVGSAAVRVLDNTTVQHLCLSHTDGVEADPALQYDSGNVEPKRGFGHIAFVVNDGKPVSVSVFGSLSLLCL